MVLYEVRGALATPLYLSRHASSTQNVIKALRAYHASLHASKNDVNKRTLVKIEQGKLVAS